MRSAFIDKLIKRMDRLEPGEVQGIVLELVREKKFQEKVFEALQEGVILLEESTRVFPVWEFPLPAGLAGSVGPSARF